jgi:methionyl-tRNA formyltransferase
MSVIAYIGRYRSRCGIDSGFSLVQDLQAAGLELSTVLVNAGDQLADQLAGHVPVTQLPAFLSLPRAQIRKHIEEPTHQAELEQCAAQLESLRPSVGLLYYGSWLPPRLSRIPSRGFLNFHPAPLPYLRGFECNTFAILRGCPRFHATVHVVRDDYDDGPVYAVSPEETLDPWCVPPELLARVDRHAPAALVEGLHNLRADRRITDMSCPPDAREFVADRSRLLEQCTVDWAEDSMVTLWRRFRAYCGQHTGVRLRALVDGACRFVDDVLVLDSKPHADAGRTLGAHDGDGEWHGCPTVAAKDGTVVLRLGEDAPAQPGFREGGCPTIMNRDLLRTRCLTAINL